jgi:hypothetical protein
MVDQHRARPPERAMKKASRSVGPDLLGVGDQVVVLGDGQGDAGDVGLLKGVEPMSGAANLPGDADDGRRV